MWESDSPGAITPQANGTSLEDAWGQLATEPIDLTALYGCARFRTCVAGDALEVCSVTVHEVNVYDEEDDEGIVVAYETTETIERDTFVLRILGFLRYWPWHYSMMPWQDEPVQNRGDSMLVYMGHRRYVHLDLREAHEPEMHTFTLDDSEPPITECFYTYWGGARRDEDKLTLAASDEWIYMLHRGPTTGEYVRRRYPYERDPARSVPLHRAVSRWRGWYRNKLHHAEVVSLDRLRRGTVVSRAERRAQNRRARAAVAERLLIETSLHPDALTAIRQHLLGEGWALEH